MQSIAAFLLLLFCFAHQLEATTIVGIWTPKKVTIAADSRQTNISNGIVTPARNPGCKVFQAHGLVFGLAGLARYDEVDIAKEIQKHTLNAEDDHSTDIPLTAVGVGAIGAVVKILQAHHATGTSNATIQLLVGGVLDGKLKMCRVEMFDFQIAGQYSFARGSRQYCYPDALNDVGHDPNRDVEIIGLDQAIKNYEKQDADWKQGKGTKVATHLISIEAADPDASKFVAPPLTIVSVTEKRARWVDPGPCTSEPER